MHNSVDNCTECQLYCVCGTECQIDNQKGEHMKTLLLSFLLASAAGLATAADNTSFNGKWQIHVSIAGNDSDQDCSLTQKDRNLTGTCTSERGTVNISGTVDENKVTWTYKSEYEGSPLTVTYTGTLDSPAKITGTVNVEEFGMQGQFTANQSK